MQKLLNSFLAIVLFFFINSCKKENNSGANNDPEPVLGNIKGMVILPTGSTIDPNSLTVHSPISMSTVSNGEFDTKAYVSEFSSLLVLNSSGGLMLMGYEYPEQSDKNISVTSTAVALVMNTPAVLSMSREGKIDMIERIKNDPQFKDLENLVAASLSAKADLFDTSSNFNDALFQKVESLMTSVAKKGNGSALETVMYTQSGKDFSFYNDGSRLVSSVIGVYKDNQRIDEIVVEGINFMPTSIKDITDLDFAAVADRPSPKYYNLSGAGQYELKMRTGRPDAWEWTVDFEHAFRMNIEKLSYNLIKPFLPNMRQNKPFCFTKLSKDIYDLQKINNYNLVALTFKVIDLTMADAEDIELCMMGNKDLYNSSYFPIMRKFFKRINLLFLPGSAFNQTLFSMQWASIHPSKDLCFKTTSNTISPCNVNLSAKLNGAPWKVKAVSTYNYGSLIQVNVESDDFLPASPYKGTLVINLSTTPVGTYTTPITDLMYVEKSEPGNGSLWVSNTVVVTSFDNKVLKGTFNARFIYQYTGATIDFTDGQFEIHVP